MDGRYWYWRLAIAFYNWGPGNLGRAIYKAGGKLYFLAIQPYLPGEKRNYVPTYIAVTYILNYAKEHEIYPDAPELALEPVPVQVDKYVYLSSLSRTPDMDKEQLYLINPKYRRRIVNGYGARPQTVVMPTVEVGPYEGLQEDGKKTEDEQ